MSSSKSRLKHVFLLLLICLAGCGEKPAVRTFDGVSSAFKKTVIVPTLDTPIPEGKSAIWCGTFQMAWNQFKQDVTKGPIQLARAVETARRLNNAPQSADDLPAGTWYAVAGRLEEGIEDRIRREMAARFPTAPVPQFPSAWPPGPAALAYAYLETGMKYKFPFLRNPDKLDFHGADGEKIAIESFGLPPASPERQRTHEMAAQVGVLYETPKDTGFPGEFAINLSKFATPFHAIVACIPRPVTLSQAVEHVEAEAARAGPGHIVDEHDNVLVPEMCWRIRHDFNELLHDDVLNKGFEGYFVYVASQMIDFRIDRTGVEIKSEAMFGALFGRKVPHSYVIDRPFLLYLKKLDAKWPFLVMWIDNAELLRRRG
jgi:hypothetical protein